MSPSFRQLDSAGRSSLVSSPDSDHSLLGVQVITTGFRKWTNTEIDTGTSFWYDTNAVGNFLDARNATHFAIVWTDSCHMHRNSGFLCILAAFVPLLSCNCLSGIRLGHPPLSYALHTFGVSICLAQNPLYPTRRSSFGAPSSTSPPNYPTVPTLSIGSTQSKLMSSSPHISCVTSSFWRRNFTSTAL
jgi:hypothetical protein